MTITEQVNYLWTLKDEDVFKILSEVYYSYPNHRKQPDFRRHFLSRSMEKGRYKQYSLSYQNGEYEYSTLRVGYYTSAVFGYKESLELTDDKERMVDIDVQYLNSVIRKYKVNELIE